MKIDKSVIGAKGCEKMYDKILAKIIWIIEKILMVLLGIAIAIISAQVFWRYVLKDPLNWSEQTARCLFIWMMMLSVPVLFYRKGAVAFDLIVDSLPKKAQDIMRILVQLVILFFACFYLKASIQLCIQTGSRILSGLEIPMNMLYTAPVVSMTLLILVCIKQIIDYIVDFVKAEEVES